MLILTFTLTWSQESCYSVQLLSQNARLPQSDLRLDESCLWMTIGTQSTVRCGCFDAYAQAWEHLGHFNKRYPNARVVTSYRYRFAELAQPREAPSEPPLKQELWQKASHDEQLELLFQIFVYAGDLEHAYATAQKALARYPDALYWHQKMAEVAQWLDKREEAMEHYMVLYRATRSPEVEATLYAYALSAYQYSTAAPIAKAKALKAPTVENIKDMIFLYDALGEPETAAQALLELYAHSGEAWLLREALRIYLNTGMLHEAQQVATRMGTLTKIDPQSASLLSYFYFATRRVDASYRALRDADLQSETPPKEYLEQLSDLAWYVKDFAVSADASRRLFEASSARQVDFERILYHYESIDRPLAIRAAYSGFETYQKSYIFLIYLNLLVNQNDQKALRHAFETLNSEQRALLEQELSFWLIKAGMHQEALEHEQAVAAFKRALALDPHSLTALSALLWHYIDTKDHYRLEALVQSIEERSRIPTSLLLPLAVGHFSLQRSDRSWIYIDRLLQEQDEGIDVALMYAYIMQGREENDAYMQVMMRVYETLHARRLAEPKLMQDHDFVERYLKTALTVVPSDRFERMLEEARSVLSPRIFTEISIYRSLRNDAHEQARMLQRALVFIEPWMLLSSALSQDDRSSMLGLLDRYGAVLPIRDRVTAARATGDLALAQSMAFEAMEHNSHDPLLYQQFRDLQEAHADTASVRTGYLKRNFLRQRYAESAHRHYIDRGVSLLADFSIARNDERRENQLATLPYYNRSARLGVAFAFDRGELKLYGGVHSAMQTYYEFSALLGYTLSQRLSIEMEAAKGAVANESLYLLLGGQKEHLSGRIDYQYLASTRLSLLLTYDRFAAQDDTELGKGVSGRAELVRSLRSGYPDLLSGLFYDFGRYEEYEGSKGVIDYLQPLRAKALPERFDNFGLLLAYGNVNASTYTRVWRPYAEFSPFYNSTLRQLSYSLGLGIGGTLWNQDHLMMGVSYSEALSGTREHLLDLYLHYKLYY